MSKFPLVRPPTFILLVPLSDSTGTPCVPMFFLSNGPFLIYMFNLSWSHLRPSITECYSYHVRLDKLRILTRVEYRNVSFESVELLMTSIGYYEIGTISGHDICDMIFFEWC